MSIKKLFVPVMFVVAISLSFILTALGAKGHVTVYSSPDRHCGAEVITYTFDSTHAESTIRFLRHDRSILLTRSFLSKDRAHGFHIVKAEWNSNSKYFVFSTVSSGGLLGGRFPTFVYVRRTNAVVAVDTVAGKWITDSEFQMQAPDLLYVTVHDTFPGGGTGDTISRLIHMDRLR
jgi:hypothetical protein